MAAPQTEVVVAVAGMERAHDRFTPRDCVTGTSGPRDGLITMRVHDPKDWRSNGYGAALGSVRKAVAGLREVVRLHRSAEMGTKEFVEAVFRKERHRFGLRRKTGARKVAGLDGMCTMRDLKTTVSQPLRMQPKTSK